MAPSGFSPDVGENIHLKKPEDYCNLRVVSCGPCTNPVMVEHSILRGRQPNGADFKDRAFNYNYTSK